MICADNAMLYENTVISQFVSNLPFMIHVFENEFYSLHNFQRLLD